MSSKQKLNDLDVKVPKYSEERSINLSSLIEQKQVLMSGLFSSKTIDEIKEIREAAEKFALAALDKESRIRATKHAIRQHVQNLYSTSNFRVAQDGSATYSKRFYNMFKHYQHSSDDELSQQFSQSTQGSPTTPPVIDATTSDEEPSTANTPKDDDADSENLLADSDSEKPTATPISDSKVTKSFKSMAKLLQTQLTDWNTKIRQNTSPIEPSRLLQRMTNNAKEDEKEPENSSPPSPLDILTQPSGETEQPHPFSAAVLATPSPGKKRTFRLPTNIEEKEETTDVHVDDDSSTRLDFTPPRVNRSNDRDILNELDKLKHQVQLHSQRLTSQGETHALRHDIMVKKDEERQQAIATLQQTIQEQRQEIETLRQELATVTANLPPDLDTAKDEYSNLGRQTEEMITNIREEMESFTQQADTFVADCLNKAKPIVDKLEKYITDLTAAATNAEQEHARIMGAFAKQVETHHRDFEKKLEQAKRASIKEAMADIDAHTTHSNQAIDATGADILSTCKDLFDKLENKAISDLDSAKLEYDDIQEESKKEFRISFPKELERVYLEERDRHTKAMKFATEIAANNETQRLKNLVTDRINATIDDVIKQKLDENALVFAAAIRPTQEEIEERKATLEALLKKLEADSILHLENSTSRLKSDLASACTSHLKTFTDMAKAKLEEFDLITQLETTMATRRKEANEKVTELAEQEAAALAAAAARRPPPPPPPSAQPPPVITITARSTLAGTEYDYRPSPGGNSGGGGDDDPDDGDGSNPDDDDDDDTDNEIPRRDQIGRARTPRNFRAAAKLYRDKLQRFMDKHKFTELVGKKMNMEDARTLYERIETRMKLFTLPIIKFVELQPNGTCIHPEDVAILNAMDPSLLQETTNALYEKLVDIIDPDDKPAKNVLNIFYVDRDGYKALFELMMRFTPKLHLYHYTWANKWQPEKTVFEFVAEIINERNRLKALNQRSYTDDEIKMELILQSRSLPLFNHVANNLLLLIDQMGPSFLANYPFTRLVRFYDSIEKHYRTHSDELSTITPTTHKTEMGQELTIHKFSGGKRSPRNPVQCELCKQFGHSIKTDHICFFAGKFMHVANYLGLLKVDTLDAKNKKTMEENATKYFNYNLPKNITKFIADYEEDISSMAVDDINILFAHKVHVDWEEPDFQVQLHDCEESLTRPSPDATPFAHKVEPPKETDGTPEKPPEPPPPPPTPFSVRQKSWSAQAKLVIAQLEARIPDISFTPLKQRPLPSDPTDVDPSPLAPTFQFVPGLWEALAPPMYHHQTEPTFCQPAVIRKARQVEVWNKYGIRLRHIQGDTGANISATNDITLLWNYKRLRKKINITTYDGNNSGMKCQAIGQGIIKVIANDNSVMEFRAYYIPNSTGTIISPDHYVRCNARIKSFTHFGHEDNGGYISFGDADGATVVKMDMERRDGLWFTSNKVLINPDVPPILLEDEMTFRLNKLRVHFDDTTIQEDAFHTWRQEMHAVLNKLENPTINSSQGYKDLELWHQRMGHIHPRSMIETSKVVDGMPSFPSNPTHFACPFCDKAKVRKQKANKQATRENFSPGAAFHMDLGFIHDTKITGKGKNAVRETLIKDRKGHTAYLLIICAATRYVWVFPLTSKQPPIDIINKFLDRHGQAHGRTTKAISTSPNGALAVSQRFGQLLAQRGLEKHEQELELDFDTQPTLPSLRYTVRTDNGGELAGSHEFLEAVANHGYTVETTAPGTSNQNGLAERPNRTLKERVRCLLYMAGLGIEFWADALLHAVWLYNRTYHSAIRRTPFEAYTGRRPLLDKLLTFGCRITAKKPGKRATTLSEHSYDGIFLGYSATTNNIVYWDPETGREKSALTPTADELHYGTEPTNRPPAARHLIEVITGSPHAERSTHDMKEKSKEFIASDNIMDHLTAECIIGASPLPYTATAAKIHLPRTEEELIRNIETLHISLNLFEPAVEETIPLHSDHPTAGLKLIQHPDYKDTVVLEGIIPGTVANTRIRNWRSRLRGSIVRMLGDVTITSPNQFRETLREKQRLNRHTAATITIQFAHPKRSDMSGEGLPTMAFDQLNVVAHHLSAIENGWDTSWDPTDEWPPIRDDDIPSIIHKGLALPKLTRRRLKESEDWPQFRDSEWVQLDKYHNQGMFGTPVRRPRDAVVLPWVWSYVYKTDPVTLKSTPKSRGTCNGGKRHGKIVTLAETYAACVEQPAHRLTWAIIAALNYVALGTDVGNAFAEADGPEETFYMYVDEQFHEWWTQHLGNDPIPHGYVIPVQKNLQGHPEGPRLWNKYIDRLLKEKMHFQPTTHEPCLYYKRDEAGHLILILRQVDDFLIAGPTLDDCQKIRNQIAGLMTNPMNDLGVIKRFNGVDIDQTREYIKLSCETYIDKIVSHHGWTNEKCRDFPIPMRNDSASLTEIQTTEGPTDIKQRKELETQMGFNYRQAIGELIFAMSTCRVDIASAVIQLSQHAANPAKCHYQATKQVFVYLNATRDHGLFYWRTTPCQSLPYKANPTTYTSTDRLQEFPTTEDAATLLGYSDATWANDKLHRRSVSGTAILLSGAVVYYRCQLQPTIALSSTEAEFAAMAETGKAALYLRSILDEIGILQSLPTNIYADNAGAICIAQAQQPTRRTKHVEIKQFAILQWTEQGYLHFKATPTQNNASDSLTKPLGRIKFYEQNETLMGRHPPIYTSTTHTIKSCSTPRIFSTLSPDYLLDPFPNPKFDPRFVESTFS